MGSTSSISKMVALPKKLQFFFQVFILGLWGCAGHEKAAIPTPTTEKDNLPVTAIYNPAPEKAGDIFIDKTKEYGLEGVKGVHLYAVDANNDGATDLVVLDDFYAAPKFYYFHKKEKKFQLGESPFSEVVRASYLVFVDLDHDGVLDVIVGNLNQKSEMTKYPARLYRGTLNKGELHYEPKSTLPTGILPTASIAPLDYNLDGEIDLFLANWFADKNGIPGPVNDILLRGKGFEFEDVSEVLTSEYEFNKSTQTYVNATPTFGASICDVDQNGFPDILTANSNGYSNKLWLNMDSQKFIDYGAFSGYSADQEGRREARGGGNSFFTLCGDYNNDEIVDVIVGNLSKDSDLESRDKSAVLTGAKKTFPPEFIRSEFYRDSSSAEERWTEGDRRGVWIDYNLDGLVDFMIENSGFPPTSRLIFFEQAQDHEYIAIEKKLGIDLLNPSGVVTLDLNGDGVMDFIAGQSRVRAGEMENRLYVFENHFPREGRKSVRFHLQGRVSNSQGISSTIYLVTDKARRFGSALYSYGSLPSQNEEGVYFAFGKEKVKSVEVKWSLGVEDRLGRRVPVVKKYDLSKVWRAKSLHMEINLCEDGRMLTVPKNCY